MDQLIVALTIYTRPGCHLCQEMKVIVERVVGDLRTSAQIEEINIANDPDLEERYGSEIPVLLVNGRKAAKYRVSEQELTRILRSRTGEAGGAGTAG
jgi:glutaredoxin